MLVQIGDHLSKQYDVKGFLRFLLLGRRATRTVLTHCKNYFALLIAQVRFWFAEQHPCQNLTSISRLSSRIQLFSSFERKVRGQPYAFFANLSFFKIQGRSTGQRSKTS